MDGITGREGKRARQLGAVKTADEARDVGSVKSERAIRCVGRAGEVKND